MHCNSWNFPPTEEVKIKKFIPSISSLLTILKSKVIIGHKSTMLRESLGFDKKVLSVNAYPLFKKVASLNVLSYKKRNNKVIWEQRKDSYKKFKSAALKVHRMPKVKYFKSLGNKEFFFMIVFPRKQFSFHRSNKIFQIFNCFLNLISTSLSKLNPMF